MAISLRGDQESSSVPTIKSKALRINLNTDIYGTFAEIGAGLFPARLNCVEIVVNPKLYTLAIYNTDSA